MRHARYIFLLILLFAVLTGCKREDEEIIPGLSWTMSDANPVLEPSNAPSTDLVSGWYNKNVWFPWVIKDGPTLKMWFTGTNTEGEESIGYATGSNGEDWTIQALVFEPSITPGSWDSGGVWNHCVIKDRWPRVGA